MDIQKYIDELLQRFEVLKEKFGGDDASRFDTWMQILIQQEPNSGYGGNYPKSRFPFLAGGLQECVFQNVLYALGVDSSDELWLGVLKEAINQCDDLKIFLTSLMKGAENLGNDNFREQKEVELVQFLGL